MRVAEDQHAPTPAQCRQTFSKAPSAGIAGVGRTATGPASAAAPILWVLLAA